MEPLKDMLASIVGSAACVYTGQPFDTVKVRMQVQSGDWISPIDCARKTFANEGILLHNYMHTYTNLYINSMHMYAIILTRIHTMILYLIGIRSLWKGSVPAFIGAVSENAVAFAANGVLKRLIDPPSSVSAAKSSSILPVSFFTGGATGFLTAFVLCPCDVIKCRSQLNRSRGIESGFTDVLFATIKKNGYRGLYTGITVQVMRDIPFYASFFGSYDVICKYLKDNTTLPTTSVYFISGGIAGQIAWILSIVPDSIKSRIQTSDVPITIIDTYKTIVRSGGHRALFTGIEVAIVRAFPANAALFVGYELTKNLLDKGF